MNNSKTYRSQTVQQVDVSQMLSGRDGQVAVAVVGVDVGKERLQGTGRREPVGLSRRK